MVQIIRYDVWGNEEDGFDVNDSFGVGTISREDYDPIETLLEYFGPSACIDNSGDFGDDREEVIDITNSKPLGALIFND